MSSAADILTRVSNDCVANLSQERKSTQDRFDRAMDSLPELSADLEKMERAGVLTPAVAAQVSSYCVTSLLGRETLDIDRTELPKWRSIGRLTAGGKDFSHHDDDTGVDWISVAVIVEGLKRFRLRYTRELPSGGKCQVETNTSTYRSLVCQP